MPSPLRGGVVLAVAVLAAGCSPGGEEATGIPAPTPATSPIVAGPLCTDLPTGSDPGGPELLTEEPADTALQWIPVLTIFEAAVRATGMAEELRAIEAVTVLAPTDEAFEETFTEDTLDDLLLFRQDELRTVLEAHLIEGSHSLTDLLTVQRLRTLDGHRLRVAPGHGGMLRLDGRAETVCGDYLVANGRIHVIDEVLGDRPKPAPKRQPGVG